VFGHAGPLGVKSQWVVGPVVRMSVGGGVFLLVSTSQGSIPVGCVPVCILSRHHPTLLSDNAKLKMDTSAN